MARRRRPGEPSPQRDGGAGGARRLLAGAPASRPAPRLCSRRPAALLAASAAREEGGVCRDPAAVAMEGLASHEEEGADSAGGGAPGSGEEGRGWHAPAAAMARSGGGRPSPPSRGRTREGGGPASRAELCRRRGRGHGRSSRARARWPPSCQRGRSSARGAIGGSPASPARPLLVRPTARPPRPAHRGRRLVRALAMATPPRLIPKPPGAAARGRGHRGGALADAAEIRALAPWDRRAEVQGAAASSLGGQSPSPAPSRGLWADRSTMAAGGGRPAPPPCPGGGREEGERERGGRAGGKKRKKKLRHMGPTV